MKNRILTFIIGVLVGSIITCGGFLVYSKIMNRSLGVGLRKPIQPIWQSGDMRPLGDERGGGFENMKGTFEEKNGEFEQINREF